MNKRFYLIVFLSITLLAGCGGKPVYDDETIINLSQRDESKYGKSLHKIIIKATPLYKDRALTRYLNKIADRLVSHMENKTIDIRVFILDVSYIRASAAPGGYIYITRGMLAALNNEDELAMVLAHEIAHVVNRDFKLGSRIKIEHDIELPDHEYQYEDFFKQNTDVFDQYTRFSFGMEFAADKFAFDLIQKAGFDVLQGMNTLQILKNYEDYYYGDEYEANLFARYSHPNTVKRISRLANMAKIHTQSRRKDEFAESTYLGKIAGMPTGPSEQEGYFKYGNYINPKHGVKLDMPGDWNVLGYDEYVYLYNTDDNAYIMVYTYPNSIHHPIDKYYLEKRLGMHVTADLTINSYESSYKATKTFPLSNGKKQIVHYVVLVNKYDLVLLKHVNFNQPKPHVSFKSVYLDTSLLKKSESHPELKSKLKLVKTEPGDTIEKMASQNDMDVDFFKLFNVIDNQYDLSSREMVKVIQ